MKIKQKDLMAMVLAFNGAKILTLETETEPRMRKTGNPFLGVKKLSTVNGMVNFNYENNVNKQREREGKEADFKADPRAWGGKMFKGAPIIEHKGKLYLSLRVQQATSVYVKDGEEVPKQEISPFLYERGKSRQGVKKEIIERDYSLASIKAVKVDGQRYVIQD